MFEKILEYQKLDGNILALKRALEKDEAKVNLNKVVVLVKDSQSKLLELENKAKNMIEEFNNCKANYDKAYNDMIVISKIDTNALSEEEINKNLEQVNTLVNNLSFLERSLSSQAENMNLIIKNFEVCRNNIVGYKQKYKELKIKVDENVAKTEPEISKIKQEMVALEKKIDVNILNKYKHLRQDRIFPVFVPLNNNACGGCSMELPAALMNKLRENGYLECEQCRRYIYLEK